MKWDAWNFLTAVKDIVVGGGRMKDGTTLRDDAGFARDMNFSLLDVGNSVTFTDNTGGTVSTTLSANAPKSTVTIPLQDLDLVNAATWKITIPYAFTVTSAGVRTGKPGTGTSASATLTTQINGTPTTGGVITMTLASQSATGVLTAGTAITATNVGTAGQTLEFAVSSVTAFTAGDAYIEFGVTNNDMANSISSIASQISADALDTTETNIRVQNYVASTTAAGVYTFVIPRDYDEATDSLDLHLLAAMSGSTDTPTLTGAAYYKRPGSAAATITASVNGVALGGGTTALALSSADQLFTFSFSKASLKRNDAITIVLTVGAHTTDSLLIYGVTPVYRSTLVSYNETDGTSAEKGNRLR